jgi:hypothetical protein
MPKTPRNTDDEYENDNWTQYLNWNYEVSDQGRVRNRWTKRLLKPVNNGFGYLQVGLYHDGVQHHKTVHSLVAECFIGERPDGYHVDHIDRNTTNNCLSNLRYLTPRENIHNKPRGACGLLGVTKRGNRYQAQISINRKFIHVGCYGTAEEAHAAYMAELAKISDMNNNTNETSVA